MDRNIIDVLNELIVLCDSEPWPTMTPDAIEEIQMLIIDSLKSVVGYCTDIREIADTTLDRAEAVVLRCELSSARYEKILFEFGNQIKALVSSGVPDQEIHTFIDSICHNIAAGGCVQ